MLKQLLNNNNENLVIGTTTEPREPVHNFGAIEPTDATLYCFFKESSGDVLTDEEIYQLTVSASRGPEEQRLFETDPTPMGLNEFVQCVNQKIVPGYNQDLTPIENVLDMELVSLQEDYILTVSGKVPTMLPNALELALQAQCVGSGGNKISEKFLGIPSTADLIPRSVPSSDITIGDLELVTTAVEKLAVYQEKEPELHFVQDTLESVNLLLDNETLADQAVSSLSVTLGEDEGVLIGMNLPFKLDQLTCLANYLHENALNFFPFWTPIRDLDRLFEEEIVETLYQEDTDSTTKEESGGPGDEFDIEGHYKGPKWRKTILEDGRHVRTAFPANILTAGKAKDVKASYPRIEHMMDLITNTQLRRAINLVGRELKVLGTVSYKFARALYVLSNAVDNAGAHLVLAEPFGKLNAFETASILVFARHAPKYWVVNRNLGLMTFKG